MVWILTYNKIFGNELADSCAEKGTRLTLEIRRIPYLISNQCENNSLKKTFEINLEQASFKRKKYFEKFYAAYQQPWFKNRDLSRKQIVTINRRRANHYSSTILLARKNLKNSPASECGHDFHLVWVCSRYEEHRLKM